MKNAVLRRMTVGVEFALVLTLLSPRITHAQGTPGAGFDQEASDSRPPAQAYEVFEELSAALDGELAKLEDVLGEDLARFNGLLRAQGLEPVGRAMQG